MNLSDGNLDRVLPNHASKQKLNIGKKLYCGVCTLRGEVHLHYEGF